MFTPKNWLTSPDPIQPTTMTTPTFEIPPRPSNRPNSSPISADQQPSIVNWPTSPVSKVPSIISVVKRPVSPTREPTMFVHAPVDGPSKPGSQWQMVQNGISQINISVSSSKVEMSRRHTHMPCASISKHH